MNVFQSAGIYCQPLEDFARDLCIDVGGGLENIWIGHKTPSKRFQVNKTGQSCLIEWNGQLPKRNNEFKRFDSTQLLNSVVAAFKSKTLVDYIFNESYLLMKWENGSFEEIFTSDLNNTLGRVLNTTGRKRQSVPALVSRKKLCPSQVFDKKNVRWPRRRKLLLLPQKKIAKPTPDTFSLDQILYNCKHYEKIAMPENFLSCVLNIPTDVKTVFDDFAQKEKVFSSNNGYYRIFRKHISDSCEDDILKPIPKKKIISFTCDILSRLLPVSFFGDSNRIRKRFYSVTAQFINSAKHEIFSLCWFYECFEPKPRWLQEIPVGSAMKIMKFVVSEVIANTLKNFFYVTECGSSGYELFFYQKNVIESLAAKNMNAYVKTGVLKIVSEQDCLGNGFSDDEMEFIPPVAKIRFLPKSSDSSECRMITIVKKSSVTDQKWADFIKRQFNRNDTIMGLVKRFLDCLIRQVGTGIQPLYTNPELKKSWNRIKEMKAMGKKLYFVKADISDAFGSVNHARLFKLLDRWCNKTKTLKELMIWEWVIRRGKLRKVSRYSFSRKVFANRVLHSVQYSNQKVMSQVFLTNVVKQVVSSQTLRIGRLLYRVQVGLCQGGAGGLSPRLCDLYYSGLDAGLRSLTCDNQSVLLRAVDDYLYVTVVKSRALDFYNMVLEGVPLYNTRFNEKKMVTNVFNDVSVFPYLGLIFDIQVLTVEPNFSRYFNTSLINFTKLYYKENDPRLNKERFLIDRSLNLNSLKIVPIVYENSESSCLLLKKFFISSCALQVKRILALALYLKSSVDSLKYVFCKISGKLATVVHKLCPSISYVFIQYVFYQVSFNFFHKYDSRFFNITKIIQMRLVRLYEQLNVSHSEIQILLVNASMKWWKPWK